MTANNKTRLTWATIIAYIICRLFFFRTRLQSYGGLIVVGICTAAISLIYLKTGKNISKSEAKTEKIIIAVLTVLTCHMIYTVYKAVI